MRPIYPRPLGKQGHRDEARVMLSDIYNWFTEGFEHRRSQGRQGTARGSERLITNSQITDRPLTKVILALRFALRFRRPPTEVDR